MRDAWQDAEAVAEYVHSVRGAAPVMQFIERPTLQALVGQVRGQDVVDLGCGAGDFARQCAEAGAASAVAVDRSAEMLRYAVPAPGVHYVEARMESITLPASSADLVVSSMALDFVEDAGGVVRRAFDWLRSGGWLVFTVQHPIVTASTHAQWVHEAGTSSAWPVDSYLTEGPRTESRGDLAVTRCHRPVARWVMWVLDAGFRLDALAEPGGSPEGWSAAKGLLEENAKRPRILAVRAERPASGRGAPAG